MLDAVVWPCVLWWFCSDTASTNGEFRGFCVFTFIPKENNSLF